MKYVFVVLLVFLWASVARGEKLPYSVNGLTSEELEWHGALDMVDKCDVVVIGTVELMTAQKRLKVIDNKYDFIMTDVLVRVSEFIKGSANAGTNYVKFAIHGGSVYDSELGEVIHQELVQEVEFEIGEKVMLFLRNKDDDPYYSNFPHGRHRIHMLTFGKRPIINGKVTFAYENAGAAKTSDLPLDLLKALGKAYQEDKDATIALENEIKALSALTDAKAEQLTNSAKRIAKGD